GALWTTIESVALGFDDDNLLHPDEVRTDGAAQVLNVASGTFGGDGHTVTGLADGSLLTVGGFGTAQAYRTYPPWTQFAGTPSFAEGADISASLLLRDGRLLVVAGNQLFAYDGQHVTTFFSELPNGARPVGAALQPSGLVLLPLRESNQA